MGYWVVMVLVFRDFTCSDVLHYGFIVECDVSGICTGSKIAMAEFVFMMGNGGG